MSRGYLVIAQNTDTVDYLRQAYALAMNLKITQTGVSNLSVCVDANTKQQITHKHLEVFDHVIDIPWADHAKESEWKIENKWKYLYMTPYNETVILDTDMIFPTDISYWWDIMSQQDVWATTNVRDFRGELVTSNYYRDTFEKNNLPNVYTAFMYFKKSELASELFAMTEIIFQHWQRMYYKYLPNGKPDHLSGDVAFALAMQLLGVEHLCTRDHNQSLPTFTHMKTHVQNIDRVVLEDNWTESLPTYFKSYKDFKVGNFQQTLPFHYVDKTWLTDKVLEQLERDYNG